MKTSFPMSELIRRDHREMERLLDELAQVAHSQQEHTEADSLVSSLVRGDLDGEEYDRTLEQLVDTVCHHIEEEESEVLPKLGALPLARQLQLGSAFVKARRAALCSRVHALTREQLKQQARNEGLSGVGGLDKRELARAVSQK